MTALQRTSVAGAILLFGATAVPVLAQLVDPGAAVSSNIPPADPFGNLPVDPAKVDRYHIIDFLRTLTSEQQTELAQRCQIVAQDAHDYEPLTASLCFAVIVAAERLSLGGVPG